jgi:hypothetical protein
MTALQDQTMTAPKEKSGQISHATPREELTVQLKRAGPTSQEIVPIALTRDQQRDHQIAQQILDTTESLLIACHLIADTLPDQMHPQDQIATIEDIAQIVQPETSTALDQIPDQIPVQILAEVLQEDTRVARIQESMTAIVTPTAKTECQEIAHAMTALLALAIRTQTAKLSLRTRF